MRYRSAFILQETCLQLLHCKLICIEQSFI